MFINFNYGGVDMNGYDIYGGVEKNINGSFTLFATIQKNNEGYLFKRQYHFYSFKEAKELFLKDIEKELKL
tara:strand:- start:646 stop:858 length:213 start_codon:yes stop_codon:yes gene_type:complete